MEIRQSIRSFSERMITVALALLAVLALALAAWQLAIGATSSSATRSAPVKTTVTGQRYVEPDAQDRSAPVKTTVTGQRYVEPDAQDRSAPIVPGPEASGTAADSEKLAAQPRQPVQSPDRAPTHGAVP